MLDVWVGMLKTTVIKFFGSQAAAARALGITRGAVHLWPKIVPLKRALQLEELTGGKLFISPSIYEIPDITVPHREILPVNGKPDASKDV